MRVTRAAQRLSALHPQAIVRFDAHVFFGDRSVETGPTCARIELGVRTEQFCPTAYTFINPRVLSMGIISRKGALGPLLASNAVLLRGELLLPFRVRLVYFAFHSCFSISSYTTRQLHHYLLYCIFITQLFRRFARYY